MDIDDYTNLIFEYFSKKNPYSQEKQGCSKTHLSRKETSAPIWNLLEYLV